MYELTEADMIWNRACGQDPLRGRPGDRALADLLRAHGLVMNGGVLHAAECLAAEELTDAVLGYHFYGFDQAASVFLRAKALLEAGDDEEEMEAREDGLNTAYAAAIPEDGVLAERFEAHLTAHPTDYAPLREKDRGYGEYGTVG